MRRKGFLLLDLIIGLGLLGILIASVNLTMVSSSKSLRIVEEKTLLIDHCQRIAESLKSTTDENNDFFESLLPELNFKEYNCDKIPEGMDAFVRVDHYSEKLQEYTVRVEREDRHVEFAATRILK